MIDWEKPIRLAVSKNPLRLLSMEDTTKEGYPVVIGFDSTQYGLLRTFVTLDGKDNIGFQLVENYVPGDKVKPRPVRLQMMQ